MRTKAVLMAATIGLALAAPAEAQDALAPELEAFRPFIGKTWRSVPPAESEKPVVDVSRWERALNGRAIRVLHSINDGEYGGESIVYWEAERKVLAYAYFTTAGHNTAGTFTVQDGALIGNEKVSGEANGVTEVRSTTRLLPDGRMHMKAEYLQKDAWVPGHEFFYVEDPSASVVFK